MMECLTNDIYDAALKLINEVQSSCVWLRDCRLLLRPKSQAQVSVSNVVLYSAIMQSP